MSFQRGPSMWDVVSISAERNIDDPQLTKGSRQWMLVYPAHEDPNKTDQSIIAHQIGSFLSHNGGPRLDSLDSTCVPSSQIPSS